MYSITWCTTWLPDVGISVEHGITLNGLGKRADIVVHGRDGKPCCSRGMPRLRRCVRPIARVRAGRTLQPGFRVRHLLVTNGLDALLQPPGLDTGAVEFCRACRSSRLRVGRAVLPLIT